jgi:hypothetical protein
MIKYSKSDGVCVLCPGRKTGAGVYRYEKGNYTPLDSSLTRDIIANVICRLESLAEGFGERFRLCKFLQIKTGV